MMSQGETILAGSNRFAEAVGLPDVMSWRQVLKIVCFGTENGPVDSVLRL